MRKTLAKLGFAIGVMTLIGHFFIYIPIYMDDGLSLFAAAIRQYSYFTILTNLGLVLIFAGAVFPNAGALKIFRTPLARATGAAAIALVALYYHIVLSPIWNPEGLAAITDTFLHYIIPSVYIIWFALFNRSGTMKFTKTPLMLIAPILYLVYIVVRGSIVGEYPYPAFDLTAQGWGSFLRSSAELLVLLAVLCLVMIGIDRIKPNLPQQSSKI